MVSISLENVAVMLGRRMVLEGISAQIDAGSLIGIVGPNGAGKSTLVRAVAGLIPRLAGMIRIDEELVEQIAGNELARRLAYLPQGQTLHWPLSVTRLVALGRLPHLAPLSRVSSRDMDIVQDAMRRADVLHLADRNALELSGGERARVLLARALAVGAAGLVADEPLASLDPGHQIDVMDLLHREACGGALVVAVLHDLTLAARYCDRLLLIDQGRLVADGAPAQVLTAETLAAVYGVTALCDMDRSPPLIVPLQRAQTRKDNL